MIINDNLLNALYLSYQGFKLQKIDIETWFQSLSLCQKSIIQNDPKSLEENLIELLSHLK